MKIKKPNRKRGISILLIAGLFLSLVSCDGNKIYEENFSVPNNSWKSDDIKEFSFDVEDTMSRMNIYVNLRTTIDYGYSNIYVFLYSQYPNGTTDKDTLEFLLAKPDGKWLGENTGTIVAFKGLIASGGRFATAGNYTFKLQHAMREDELAEIVDVGMRVEIMEDE